MTIGADILCAPEAPASRAGQRPRELLDLGDPQTIRLSITSPAEKMGKVEYVCLSHCWGGVDALKLKADNLARFEKDGIDASTLPATYRDAVDITRRLGFRYLWIDSLCIIQGSTLDWRQEASKMADVYSNAVVTLAALASRSSLEGIYVRRDALAFWPCILPTTASKLDLTVWNERLWPFHDERVATSPLLQRGWVMQERCLGPRMLFFGRFGIYWECATILADELYTGCSEMDHIGDTNDDMIKAMVNRRLYLVGQDAFSFPIHVRIDELEERGDRPHPQIVWKFLGYWHRIVRLYSRMNLTFSRDKLVAMAGLIELVQSRTALTSLAGLWRELLLDDMLWSSAKPKSASRPSEYRAPSFSWASIDGEVHRKFDRWFCEIAASFFLTDHSGIPHRLRAKYLAQVVSDSVEMVDPTRHTGEVLRAELILKGLLVHHTCRKVLGQKGQSTWSHPWYRNWEGIRYGFLPRWLDLDVEADGESGTIDVALLPVMAWYEEKGEEESGKAGKESKAEEQENKEKGKPEGTANGDPGTAYKYFHVAGLVLQSCGSSDPVYRRVGIFEDCNDAASRWLRRDPEYRDMWTLGRSPEILKLI